MWRFRGGGDGETGCGRGRSGVGRAPGNAVQIKRACAIVADHRDVVPAASLATAEGNSATQFPAIENGGAAQNGLHLDQESPPVGGGVAVVRDHITAVRSG